MAEKGWHRTVRSADLKAGDIFPASLGPRFVLLARLNTGDAVAFSANCPHQGTDLETATLWENQIRCPRHQYIYDSRTGRNIFPTERFGPDRLWKTKPGYLPTYATEERDGWIWVYQDPRPPPKEYDPKLEIPPPGAELEVAAELDDDAGPTEQLKVVRVRQGAEFELRLPINPLPGNVWQVEVVGDLLEIVDEGLRATDPPKWGVKVHAHEVGEDAIECRFRAPWDIEPSELRRYVVQVVNDDGGGDDDD